MVYKSEMKEGKKNNKVLWFFLTVIMPLALGGIFYFVFCQRIVFVDFIDELLGKGHNIIELPRTGLFVFARNYGLDGIWAFSLTSFLLIVMGNNKYSLIISVLIAIILGMCLELIQYNGLVKGTFDFFDILAETIGTISALIIFLFHRRKEKQ